MISGLFQIFPFLKWLKFQTMRQEVSLKTLISVDLSDTTQQVLQDIKSAMVLVPSPSLTPSPI